MAVLHHDAHAALRSGVWADMWLAVDEVLSHASGRIAGASALETPSAEQAATRCPMAAASCDFLAPLSGTLEIASVTDVDEQHSTVAQLRCVCSFPSLVHPVSLLLVECACLCVGLCGRVPDAGVGWRRRLMSRDAPFTCALAGYLNLTPQHPSLPHCWT